MRNKHGEKTSQKFYEMLFVQKCLMLLFSNYIVDLWLFCCKEIGAKTAQKMLVKLAEEANFTKPLVQVSNSTVIAIISFKIKIVLNFTSKHNLKIVPIFPFLRSNKIIINILGQKLLIKWWWNWSKVIDMLTRSIKLLLGSYYCLHIILIVLIQFLLLPSFALV